MYDPTCPACQWGTKASAPASGWTAGQRITMESPRRKGMCGVITGVSGDGETLLVQFDGNEYASLVGKHQVKQSNDELTHRRTKPPGCAEDAIGGCVQ